ncbi:PREDICTED: diphthine methyltransferase [Nicrophorus vespilloides]|uniref:methylated diphthine methylhydrolase n=1 Tax=Nicrophorus vespilloides TaxID=110193 RepID=A0ABM1M8N6_NICVS|nr:PREDICTED: diphthine methyltransferase [Nicrophorus vespilloides]
MCEDLNTKQKFPPRHLQVLHRYDTEYNADSVEWCPIEPYRNYFVCANYQLEELVTECAPPESPRNTRFGRIMLFCLEGKELALKQCIRTAAILDLKWCHVALNGVPVLGAVDAMGSLIIYKLTDEKLELIDTQTSKTEGKETLMLSLDWSTGVKQDNPKIITSDSNGYAHSYTYNNVLEKIQTYKAHKYEAWIAAFYYWDTNIFYTGGDDSYLLMFDARSGLEPVIKNRSHLAGVTCIHSNPFLEFIVASGSYDESVKIWDMRHFKSPLRETKMPGTMWRLKWDPYVGNHLLAACMLGGVHVLECKDRPNVVESFYDHEKIAYGVDWRHATVDEDIVIASCSFYDHLLCVSQLKLDF